MSSLYDKIIAQRGSLERLVAKIPGFKGYHEKEARRQADEMLRDFIADKLDIHIRAFTALEVKMLDKVGLSIMSETRDVKAKMQQYRDMVKTAMPKYSAMWAQLKIGTTELEKIYAFDEAQLIYVEKFGLKIHDLEVAIEAGQEVAAPLDEIMALADEAIDAYNLRDNEILSISDL